MKKVLLFFIACQFTACIDAQNLIAVQNGSQVNFYTDFHTALHAAPSGATMYLPGGSFGGNYYTDTILQTITIIGAGHYPDSTLATGKTFITGTLYFGSNSDNSSIQGVDIAAIYFTQGAIVNNISLSRCYVHNFSLDNGNYASIGKNCSVTECVVDNLAGGSETGCCNYWLTAAVNLNLIKSIVTNIDLLAYSTISNCILGQMNNYSSCNFINNIFTDSIAYGYVTSRNDCIYSNNIFKQYTNTTLNNGTGCSFQNNFWGQTTSQNFTNVQSDIFSYTYNYHLLGSSVGKNSATDGYDVGIYGTAYPFKVSSVPTNPHIQYISIASQTTGGGSLPANIHVAAQNN